jgi:hypothetical protein
MIQRPESRFHAAPFHRKASGPETCPLLKFPIPWSGDPKAAFPQNRSRWKLPGSTIPGPKTLNRTNILAPV